MPRPSNWNAPTESVRIPKHSITACLNLAKALDQPLALPLTESNAQSVFAEYVGFVQNAVKPKLITITNNRETPQSYLLRLDQAITLEQYQASKQQAESLITILEGELSNDERLWLVSQIAAEYLPPVKVESSIPTTAQQSRPLIQEAP